MRKLGVKARVTVELWPYQTMMTWWNKLKSYQSGESELAKAMEHFDRASCSAALSQARVSSVLLMGQKDAMTRAAAGVKVKQQRVLSGWRIHSIQEREMLSCHEKAIQTWTERMQVQVKATFEWWRCSLKLQSVLTVWSNVAAAEALRTWRHVAANTTKADQARKLASGHAKSSTMRKKLRQEMRRRLGVKSREPDSKLESLRFWRDHARETHLQQLEEDEENQLDEMDIESFLMQESEREHSTVAAATHAHRAVGRCFTCWRSTSRITKKLRADADLHHASKMVQSLTAAFGAWAEPPSDPKLPLLGKKLSKEACRAWLQEKYLSRESQGGLDILRNKYIKEKESGVAPVQPKSQQELMNEALQARAEVHQDREMEASWEEVSQALAFNATAAAGNPPKEEEQEVPSQATSWEDKLEAAAASVPDDEEEEEEEEEEEVVSTPSKRRVSLSEMHKVRLSLGSPRQMPKIRVEGVEAGLGDPMAIIDVDLDGLLSPLISPGSPMCSPVSPRAPEVA